VTTNIERCQRIARFYDFLDAPFGGKRCSALRPLLVQDLDGTVLDAGVGTGRNCAYYPPDGAAPA
jgi:hypothetical protein